MARHTHILIALGLVGTFAAVAQPPLPPGPKGGANVPPPPPATVEGSSATSSNSTTSTRGDVITLVTGKKLERVQVLSESPARVEVQLAPGVPPMTIRRSHITDIQYDDIDPNDRSSRKNAAQGAEPGEVEAEPLAPELNEKLGMDIQFTPRDVPGRDLLRVMGNIAKELSVPLEFSPAVQQLAPDARKWTILIPTGTTLRKLLETDILRDFPNLQVNYQFDKIVIDVNAPAAE